MYRPGGQADFRFLQSACRTRIPRFPSHSVAAECPRLGAVAENQDANMNEKIALPSSPSLLHNNLSVLNDQLVYCHLNQVESMLCFSLAGLIFLKLTLSDH